MRKQMTWKWGEHTTLEFSCGCSIQINVLYGTLSNDAYPQVPSVTLGDLCAGHQTILVELAE